MLLNSPPIHHTVTILCLGMDGWLALYYCFTCCHATILLARSGTGKPHAGKWWRSRERMDYGPSGRWAHGHVTLNCKQISCTSQLSGRSLHVARPW